MLRAISRRARHRRSGPLQAERQLVPLAPAHRCAYILDHGIPRQRPVLVHRARDAKWVAQSWLAELIVRASLVPARGGRRLVIRLFGGPRRRSCIGILTYRARAAPGSATGSGARAARSRARRRWRRCLTPSGPSGRSCSAIAAPARARSCVVGGCPDSLDRAPPARGRARAHVAVGQHPWHVPARVRLPRSAPARAVARRRAPREWGANAGPLDRRGDRLQLVSSTRTASSS